MELQQAKAEIATPSRNVDVSGDKRSAKQIEEQKQLALLEEARKQAYKDKKEMAARVQARMNEENNLAGEQHTKDAEKQRAEREQKAAI